MRRAKPNILTPVGYEQPQTFESSDPTRTFHVEREEAIRLVNASRGRAFYLHVEQFAPRKDRTSNTKALIEGFAVRSSVAVSKAEALGFIDRAYNSARINESANVRIAFCSMCFFIG